MRHPLIFVSVVAVALGLAACQQSGGNSAETDAPDPDNVVARVNGKALGETALDAQMQALSARGQSADKAQALQELITVELLAQEAEQQGLPGQPEIAAQIDRQRASLLAQHLIRAELDSYEVSDEDLRARYDQQVAATKGSKEYKARHILVDKEDEARSLIKQLDEGADFQALAKEHSTGPSGAQGGNLGWFQANAMVPPFARAVQSLEPGNYTEEPVKTQFGWHVVLLEDTRAAEPPEFEDMRSQLRNRMVSEHIQQFVADLRQQGDVEIVADDLKPSSATNDAGSGATMANPTADTADDTADDTAGDTTGE